MTDPALLQAGNTNVIPECDEVAKVTIIYRILTRSEWIFYNSVRW
jgi:hypothetical protein